MAAVGSSSGNVAEEDEAEGVCDRNSFTCSRRSQCYDGKTFTRSLHGTSVKNVFFIYQSDSRHNANFTSKAETSETVTIKRSHIIEMIKSIAYQLNYYHISLLNLLETEKRSIQQKKALCHKGTDTSSPPQCDTKILFNLDRNLVDCSFLLGCF